MSDLLQPAAFPTPLESSDSQAQSARRQVLPPSLTPRRPTTYTFELTTACNHRCVGCGNVFSHNSPFMSGERWLNLIDLLKDDLVSLRVTGGECTLHPDFEAIIDGIDNLSVPFVVFTNGNWHKPDEIIKLLSRCKNLTGILVSLHGHDRATYRNFVGVDSFDQVTANIRQAARAGIRVGTNTLLLRSTVEHIATILRLGLSLGAESVAFSRHYGRPMAENLNLDDETFKKALLEILARQKHEPRLVINNCIPLCFLGSEIPAKGCTSGFTHCTIDPLGNARPCTHTPLTLGNLFEQSISDIWASEKIEEWRDYIPEGCINCQAFHLCRGGCRATAYHQNLPQDPLIGEPITRPMSPSTLPVKLYRHAHLKTNYQIRREAFGSYLINDGFLLPVSLQADPILESLAQSITVLEVRERFGQVGLDFVGTLVLHGLIEPY